MRLTRIAPLAALLAAAPLATAQEAAAQQPAGSPSPRPAAADSQFVTEQPVRFNNREGSQYTEGSTTRSEAGDAGAAQPLGTPVRQDAAGGQAQGGRAATGAQADRGGNRPAAERTRMRVRKES